MLCFFTEFIRGGDTVVFNTGQRVRVSPQVKDAYRNKTGDVVSTRDSNGMKAQLVGIAIPNETKTIWFWGYELTLVDK